MTDKNFEQPEPRRGARRRGPAADEGSEAQTPPAPTRQGAPTTSSRSTTSWARRRPVQRPRPEDAVLDRPRVDAAERPQAPPGRVRQLPSPHRGAAPGRDRAREGRGRKGLLPVLDDLDRAAKHGDLVEGTPFAAIAEKVRGRRRAARRRLVRRRGRGVRPAAPRGDLPAAHPRCGRDRRSSRSSRWATASATSSCGLRRSSSPFRPSRREEIHGQPGLVRQGLLQDPRGLEGRQRRRSQEDVSQARAQVPPRLQSG